MRAVPRVDWSKSISIAEGIDVAPRRWRISGASARQAARLVLPLRLYRCPPGGMRAGSSESDLRRELDDRILHDTAVELELRAGWRSLSENAVISPDRLELAPADLAPVRD